MGCVYSSRRAGVERDEAPSFAHLVVAADGSGFSSAPDRKVGKASYFVAEEIGMSPGRAVAGKVSRLASVYLSSISLLD